MNEPELTEDDIRTRSAALDKAQEAWEELAYITHPKIPCPECSGAGSVYGGSLGDICVRCEGRRVLDAPGSEPVEMPPFPQLRAALTAYGDALADKLLPAAKVEWYCARCGISSAITKLVPTDSTNNCWICADGSACAFRVRDGAGPPQDYSRSVPNPAKRHLVVPDAATVPTLEQIGELKQQALSKARQLAAAPHPQPKLEQPRRVTGMLGDGDLGDVQDAELAELDDVSKR